MIAKSVIKNKYWIVEDNGQKIATIQAVDQGGYVYVHNSEREPFPSIKLLSKTYNITFDSTKFKPAKEDTHSCYGYPCNTRPHNLVWDVQRKLPIYSSSAKSRSLLCAGYYAIKFNNTWVGEYCPKNITTSRHEFVGPFKTKQEQQEFLTSKKA